jgi:phosphoglycerate dehydrogenase-like enzyme
MAPVHAVAADAGDAGNATAVLGGDDESCASPRIQHLAEELPDTDIFVGYSLRPEQLVDAHRLKWIHSTAAGVAQLMYPELRDSGIVVTNPSGIFSVPLAEHTMGLLLALVRNLPDSVPASGAGALGAAGDMGSAAAPYRVEWASVADRGIWFDRPGTRATRHSV